MEQFEILEDGATADIVFKAHGETLAKAYQNAGLALFHIMVDRGQIREQESIFFTIEAEDKEALLLDFLNELIYRFDTEQILISKFFCEVEEIEKGYRLAVEGKGEKLNLKKHQVKAEIKAATYFDMKIKRIRKGKEKSWLLKVTLDL